MNPFRAFVVCCTLVACARGPAGDADSAAAPAAGGTNTVSGDPVCKLFSSADAARYIGERASDGEISAGGCQWSAADESGDMTVAIVPAANHEPPKASAGYKPVADVGREGFVAPYLGGWLAGAIVGDEAIRVSVDGTGASEATAIALLKEVIERHK